MNKLRGVIGIRGQFLVLLGLLIGAVAGITAMLSAEAQRDGLLEERRLRGESVLRSWTAMCRERLLSDETMNLSMWDYVDDLMKSEPAVVEVFLLDSTGRYLLHNNPKLNGLVGPDTNVAALLSKPMPGVFRVETNGGQYLHFYAPVVVGERRLGLARIVFSSQGIEEGIRESTRSLMVATSVVAVLGLVLMAFLVVGITKPIRLLTEGVREFGGKFDPTNPETANYQIHFKAPNELGQVRDAFNEMTSTLYSGMLERKKLKEETSHLREQATTDGLTGLFNKRQFQEEFPVLLQLAKQRRAPLSLLMLDMDRFKQLNDTEGHKAGDLALQDLAKAIRSKTRSSDRAYRIGGDEFVLISVGAHVEAAMQLSTRVAEEYDRIKDPRNMTGISFGIMEYDFEKTPEEFLQAADQEMYRVKREKKAGR